MKEPRWIPLAVVMAIQEAQLAEHGGQVGARDQGLLEAALARPQQILAYGGNPHLTQLAAAYAVGIARNHPFLDGNKRTAWVVCATLLEVNGRRVIAGQSAVVEIMLAVAAGSAKDQAMTLWLDHNTR
jgi:death-on-curing protein